MPVVEKGFVKVGQSDYEAIMRLAFGKSQEKSAQAGGQKSSDKSVGNEDLLYGALAGMGSGLLSDMMTPLDEDESPLKRALTRILHGAALGGVAGLGIRTVRRLGGGKSPAAAPVTASEKKAQDANAVPVVPEISAQQTAIKNKGKSDQGDPLAGKPTSTVSKNYTDAISLVPGAAWGYGIGKGVVPPIFNALKNGLIVSGRAGGAYRVVPTGPIKTMSHDLSVARNINPSSDKPARGVLDPSIVYGYASDMSSSKPGVPKVNNEIDLLRSVSLFGGHDQRLVEALVKAVNKSEPGHSYGSVGELLSAIESEGKAQRPIVLPKHMSGYRFRDGGEIAEAAGELARKMKTPVAGSSESSGERGFGLYGKGGVLEALLRNAKVHEHNQSKAMKKELAKESLKAMGKGKMNELYKGHRLWGRAGALVGMLQAAARAAYRDKEGDGMFSKLFETVGLKTPMEREYQTDGDSAGTSK